MAAGDVPHEQTDQDGLGTGYAMRFGRADDLDECHGPSASAATAMTKLISSSSGLHETTDIEMLLADTPDAMRLEYSQVVSPALWFCWRRLVNANHSIAENFK